MRQSLRDRLTGKSNNRGKNLVRVPGGYQNQHGVFISEAEKKALESKVTSANRKRKKQLAELQDIPRIAGGRQTGGNALETFLMGKENDLIISPKSKSLQRFKSREQFASYMKMLDRVNSKDYVRKRMRLYKANYLKACQREFGGAGMDIYMKVRMMPLEEFMSKVAGVDELMISFVYGAEEGAAKREQMRAVLGMKSKE